METRWRTKKLRVLVKVAVICLVGAIIYGGIKFWPEISGKIFQENSKQQIKKGEEQGELNLQLAKTARAKRNSIYDRNLQELAVSLIVASVYVKPLELIKEEGVVKKLSALLGLNEKELSSSLDSERGNVWLARNVELEIADVINKMGLAGVYTEKEEVRYYPNGREAAHVIGFSKGEQGLAGIESYYDDVLLGDVRADFVNLVNAGIDYPESLGRSGASIVLTLDLQLQSYLEHKLSKLIDIMQARSAMAIIIVPETGEILALANIPSYDVNFFWKSDSFERRNRVLTEPTKAGALMNIFRMAAELEQGNIPEFVLVQEEIAQKIIEPRYLKKVVSEKVRRFINPNWKKLAEGIYWSAPDKKVDFVVSERDLNIFSQKYGFFEECNVDLPCSYGLQPEQKDPKRFSLNDLHSSTTSLKLLTAFSRLISGNISVTPHVLKKLWIELQDDTLAANFDSKKNPANHGLGINFLKLLNVLSPSGTRKGIFIETLAVEDDFRMESDVEFSDEINVPGSIVDYEEKQDDSHFQDVILSAAPFHAPEVAMILVIDGVVVDFSSPSISRPYVEKIIKKALKLSRTTDKNTGKAKSLQGKDLYLKWSKLNDNPAKRELSKKYKLQKMPSVKDLSLRKALQVLQTFNLRIKVVGSGKVTLQHPLPGTLLKDISDCTLELQSGNFH